MKRRLLAAAFVLGAALASFACASEQKAAAPAVSPSSMPSVTPPPTGATPEGAQFAISDAPSSGAASNRPQMNASAAQAYNAGLVAFQQGNLEGAATQFRQAAAADPKAYQAHYSLAVVQERLGNRADALAEYQRATSILSDYEPAIVSYAVLLANSDRAADAEQYLRSRQAKMPNSAAVLGALAEVKSIQGDSGEAQRLAQEALKKNPDYRPAMVTLARDHYRTRRLDLALYTLKGILDGYGMENPPRDKKNAEAHLLRGLIYKEQRNRAGAIDEFKRSLELRPDLVEARAQLGAYLLEAGNASEAANLLEGALRYDKNHELVHLNLGDAYRLLGRTEDAKRELEWVKERDANLPQVHYNLGLLYLLSPKISGVTPKQSVDLAISELEQYRKLRPRSVAGTPDDADELITRAKAKKALIEAQELEKTSATSAPAPAATAPATAQKAAAPAPAAPPSTPSKSTGSLPPVGAEK